MDRKIKPRLILFHATYICIHFLWHSHTQSSSLFSRALFCHSWAVTLFSVSPCLKVLRVEPKLLCSLCHAIAHRLLFIASNLLALAVTFLLSSDEFYGNHLISCYLADILCPKTELYVCPGLRRTKHQWEVFCIVRRWRMTMCWSTAAVLVPRRELWPWGSSCWNKLLGWQWRRSSSSS